MQLSKNKILVAMAQNNYTTKDLAKAYGVSCSRINFILNSREVRPTTVAKLSKALNVDVTEILEDQKGSENMETYLATAKEVAAMLGVSESMSYKIIKMCNQELRKKGYITVRGKVPREYLKERVGIKEVVTSD